MAYVLLNPYCSLVDLCEELKMPLPGAESALEDELKKAIFHASRWVDDYTRRDYYFHDYSEVPLTLDQFSTYVVGNRVFLPFGPVISIDAVSLGDTELVADTDFSAEMATGIIYRTSGDWNPSRPDNALTIYGTFGYPQLNEGEYDPTVVPAGIPGKISLATRLVAAALSGHNRKEIVGFDGDKQSFVEREIPKTVYQTLGKRMPILT